MSRWEHMWVPVTPFSSTRYLIAYFLSSARKRLVDSAISLTDCSLRMVFRRPRHWNPTSLEEFAEVDTRTKEKVLVLTVTRPAGCKTRTYPGWWRPTRVRLLDQDASTTQSQQRRMPLWLDCEEGRLTMFIIKHTSLSLTPTHPIIIPNILPSLTTPSMLSFPYQLAARNWGARCVARMHTSLSSMDIVTEDQRLSGPRTEIFWIPTNPRPHHGLLKQGIPPMLWGRQVQSPTVISKAWIIRRSTCMRFSLVNFEILVCYRVFSASRF